MANNNSPDNASVYNTPPEEIFTVFPYDNQQANNPPQYLFPVFQYDDPPPNTPPEVLFPSVNNPPHYNPAANYPPHYNPPANYPPQSQPRPLRGKQARRNARCAWRIQHGLPRVPTSDDDSSASSQEGYVSDDSFY